MKLKMRIGARILAGYGAALLVVAAVGIVAYRSTAELIESADSVTYSHKVKEMLSTVLSNLKDAETGQRGFILTGEESYLEPYSTAVKVLDGNIRDLRELTAENPNEQKEIAPLRDLVAGRLAELAKIIALRRGPGGERTALQELLTDKGKNLMDEIRRVIGEMDEEEVARLKQRDLRAKATAHFAITTMLAGGLLVLVLVSIAGILVQRSITIPLSVFMKFVERVGEGDLTQQAKISSADELGELALSLDGMVVGLRDVAGQTRLATVNLNSAAAEILASTQQQAAGTGEQAAAIQQTTITMEEVTQSGVQISDRAKEVATSAEATSAASRAGLQAVENTNRSMETIREQAEAVAENVVLLSEKTQAIGEIISTVNDLAEQSHLLALNAAIEAAAAGENGRRFSVIAGEVKNLADQSREATVHVRSILGDIQKGINTSVMLTEEAVKRVDAGKQEADVADRTIREMTENIQQSVQAFQQIVAGANQQQIGFRQVMQAVRDIGQASQQTASSTSQLEKAAVGLTALAQQLQKAVDRYRI
jgi:methyl-accepting chemotaxis protein